MKIGELAKRMQLAPSKIRFYESIGLLPKVSRSANGYRDYSPETEAVLNLIVQGQQAGFSLDELRPLLPSDSVNWDHSALVDALRKKLTETEKLEAKLKQNKRHLRSILEQVEAKPEDVSCAENARRVITAMGLDWK
ncbi:MerR family DNA-binding transcriptional regulator [Salinimonas iocasae]|uniref:MerR family DNA-binding transcriptional regulator n=1 Tax=Salinimonas iocasae TaxID=2572577 RepID=A0A5B7YH85_9ALTE|nr:MerR family DNA-binding transcriptional regulator [Salinimonas iocasae]QCZ94633.1 MerR family DNA-binding transcriptional regulator [Salinimonas iocasae]